jgi:hypothetical protein
MHANGVEQPVPARHGLGHFARRLWQLVRQSFNHSRLAALVPKQPPPTTGGEYEPLNRVRLTDGVSRTLFEEYAAHRATEQGQEETGWLLLGLRDRSEAVALATLPAGTERDSGVAHVRFNSLGQAIGSRIVRQHDRRLTILGVVHTHPGSLRHPSDGDFEGDRNWVRNLRGGQGVFGIGTADERRRGQGNLYSHAPKHNAQVLGDLCFSWYSLSAGEWNYQPLTVELTLGPDLARPLHDVWPILEAHAPRLERLFRQQAGLTCEVVNGEEPALALTVPLADAGSSVRVLLSTGEPRFLVKRGPDLFSVDPGAKNVEQGVYLLLAELADQF